MTLASSSASRWAVSARSGGEVLTAGINRSELELVVLGVPAGFSQPEIEGWLHDLAGVAVETSRADTRTRAIPALLHHALTGLLFSHSELWDRLELPKPCSSAFVDRPEGAAFGWVGEARVHVLVDGDPVEPQWVLVRDEGGREARAAVFAPGSDVVVTLDYWPQGADDAPAPASLEAEWICDAAAGQAAPQAAAAPPRPEPAVTAPEADVHVEPAPAPPAVERAFYPDLPESLPVQQPGLAEHPYERSADVPQPAQPEARFEADVASRPTQIAPARVPVAAEPPASQPDAAEEDVRFEAAPVEQEAVEPEKPQHPVARWLARVLGWGRRAPRGPEPALVEDQAAPVSAYDSLISEPGVPDDTAQTALDLAGESAGSPSAAAAPAMPAEPVGLRPAGIADVLGARATDEAAGRLPAPPASEPAAPATGAHVHQDSPSGSFAVNQRLQDLLREMEEADVEAMPRLSPEVPAQAGEQPLGIDHEPVGAHETFAIPQVPRQEGASPPAATPEPEPPADVPPPVTGHVVISDSPPVHEPEPASPPAAEVEPAPPPASAEAPAAAELPPAAAPEETEARVATPAPAPPPAPVIEFAHRELDLPPVPRPLETTALTEPVAAPEAPRAAEPPAAEARAAAPSFEDDSVPWLEDRRRGEAPVRRARAFEAPEEPLHRKVPLLRRPVTWAVGVVAVFLVGWLVGGLASPGDRGGPIVSALRAIGLGPAQFSVSIDSSPSGAQIEIDGKPQATRTPAKLDLTQGDHTVKLLLPGLGGVTVPLKGRRGEKLTVSESLNGTLEVLDPDSSVPIAVTIDGRKAGYAPLKVESIEPGLHELHFSGPGMPAWVQTVEVGVRATAQLVARPMSAPADGVIQAQATINDETGSAPLPGAQVYVDGTLKGVTPLTIELPRGPHSLRVVYRGESAPVQVIDLPGGNQRFAMFQFGLDTENVTVTPLGDTKTFAAGQSTLLSAGVEGLTASDLGEAWLRVRTGEGLWRRYSMTPLKSSGQLVVASVFPDGAFDRNGETRWYVSVTTRQGDEYYSEVQTSKLARGSGGRSSR